ncbi:MAG: VOC family protein [Planctomycetota bacterium]
MSVNPIPPNCNSVNLSLVVKDANGAIELYKRAFGATGGACLNAPDGSVMHAEIQIGNSTIMLGEENEQWGMISAESMGGSPISIMLYVDDCDATFQQAIDAGCEVISPVADMFWGDRHGRLKDPFGYQWGIATHIEDVSEEEMDRRGKAWLEEMSQGKPES